MKILKTPAEYTGLILRNFDGDKESALKAFIAGVESDPLLSKMPRGWIAQTAVLIARAV